MKIKNVVVIGSGTMGSGIAAHLCNANIPVTLLDLKTEISQNARERIHKSRPPLLMEENNLNHIIPGNIENDMETLKAFQESIDIENAEVIDLYNTAKSKQPSVSDKIDAEIVEDVGDAPEKVLAS